MARKALLILSVLLLLSSTSLVTPARLKPEDLHQRSLYFSSKPPAIPPGWGNCVQPLCPPDVKH